MAEKDATEKKLESYADVFSDLVNVLLFEGKRLMLPRDLLDALPRSIYKVDKKLHEQERDVAKFWKKGRIRIAFIGLENQTDIEADMPLRIISYDGAVYRDQMNQDEKDKPKERFPVVTLKIPAYSGAKAAVSNFTQWLAVHFSKEGIRVNAIAPGFFATAQNRALLFNEDGTPTARSGKISNTRLLPGN